MNDKKHVIVGLFVLVGFVLLGAMVVWFEGVAILIRGGYVVQGHLPNAVGVRAGKRVHLDGIEIGEVRAVATSQPEQPGVWVEIRVNPEVRIPANAQFVAQQSTIGDLFLNFEGKVKPEGYLPIDGSARLTGVIKSPTLLPEDLTNDLRTAMASFKGLDAVLANLKELTTPRTLADLKAGKPKNLWTTLEQFEDTTRSLQNQLDNKDSDLRQLLASAAAAAKTLQATLIKAGAVLDSAEKTIATIDRTGQTLEVAGQKTGTLLDKTTTLMEKLSHDADAAKTLLDNMNAVADGVRQGKGTLGKLVNDDDLHRALLTLIEDLQVLSDNTNRAMIMWRKEGLFAKEGK